MHENPASVASGSSVSGKGKDLHRGGAAGGLALSVLTVMHKESRLKSRKSLAIRQELLILLYQQPCAVQESGIRPRNSD